ncbi:hypothetical protein BWD09_07920 [Neisseria dentiae]|uniref:Uncharacterized protein n=2 Tax=Neisseria dentiae TaxID=194197 RepID=A0A1X3D855_9NEIS|nr:hypothetical protein BWD09_07920 [Neisseria dentiae]STZ51077.1 Uncharacterised protein [Neisseria dentiae]
MYFWNYLKGKPSTFWFSLLSLVVSALTLIYLIKQVDLSREHNRNSVKPYLNFYAIAVGNNKDGLYLSNEGLGPALITEISINGKRYPDLRSSDWQKITKETGLTYSCFAFGALKEKMAIRAGADDVPLIVLSKSTDLPPTCYLESLALQEKIILKVKYTSMYKESEETALLFKF